MLSTGWWILVTISMCSEGARSGRLTGTQGRTGQAESGKDWKVRVRRLSGKFGMCGQGPPAPWNSVYCGIQGSIFISRRKSDWVLMSLVQNPLGESGLWDSFECWFNWLGVSTCSKDI